MWLMYTHPAWQLAAVALALYVFRLGWARVRSLHMAKPGLFKRKRHVLLGQVVMYAWLSGVVGGMVLAHDYWHGWLQTGFHAWVGMIMSGLIVWGLASGLYMAKQRKKRTVLPVLHGLGNAFLILLAIAQFFSGRALLEQIMLDL